MLPFARMLSIAGAAVVNVQVGNANDAMAPPGQKGAQVGDFAIWLQASPPSGGWTMLTNNPFNIYTKLLTASDLTLAKRPSDAWGLLIYRDPTSAALRPETGFNKSAAHMGVVAILNGSISSPPPQSIATPPDTRLRITTSYTVYDISVPLGPYPDGTAFTPGAGGWTILELLRI